MAGWLVARMSRHRWCELSAKRVMPSKPGPAVEVPTRPRSRLARAVERSCGRCELKATCASCSSGERYTTRAPMRSSHWTNSGPGSLVKIQERPAKSWASADSTPWLSLPAMGWPPTKRGRCAARSTMSLLVLPASVTRAPGLSRGANWSMVFKIAPMGCERKTRSACGTISASVPPWWMTPRSLAFAKVDGLLTPRMRPSKPAARRARAKEPPMSPTPMMATLIMGWAGEGARPTS